MVLRELEKLESQSPNNKPTITFNTQRDNIQRNQNLKDNSKLFLIELMQEVFSGKETMTSSEFKDSLTNVVFEKSNHILGFELTADSSKDDESLATAEASEEEKSVVPAVFTKKIKTEKLPESEASEISEDSKDAVDSEKPESENDDSYYI